MNIIRGCLVAAIIAIITLIGIPFQYIFVKFKLAPRRWLPVLYHNIVLWLLRIKIKQSGEVANDRPLLFVSNHTSWLDILILSSFTPCSFIAKNEIADWPLFGFLAKLQRTLFINRQKRSDTQTTNDIMQERLKKGEPMILFAEGTTSEGTRVLPFKSSLFGVASFLVEDEETAGLYIQPVCITYHRLQGLPMNRTARLHTAWIGDMGLLPHLWNIIKGGPLDTIVSYGEPIPVKKGYNRKELAKKTEEIVRNMNVAALRG